MSETHVSEIRGKSMDKEILREFIQVYKTKQCLWDPKSLHYFNRQMRRIALEDLLIILKKLHPASNIDSVRLKIDILRTNYNRERKKVQRSSEIGKEIYVPSLWYYKELNFLADILKPNAEGLNKEENELDECDPPSKKIKKAKCIKKKDSKTKKGKKHDEDEKLDEFDSFGKIIAIELRKLKDPHQSIAQKLMSDILFYSKMGKITEDTSIYVPMQNVRRTPVNSRFTSSSNTNVYEEFPVMDMPESSNLPSSTTQQNLFDDPNMPLGHNNINYQMMNSQTFPTRADNQYMFPRRNLETGKKVLENYVMFKK